MYWKGFEGNKPKVHMPPLNNYAWARQLTSLLKGNQAPSLHLTPPD